MHFDLHRRRRSPAAWRLALASSVASVALVSGPAIAQTAPVTFFGEDFDPRSGTSTSTPQADQARANFFANLQGVGTETFEGVRTGTLNPSIGFPGVGTATLNGAGDVESGPSGSDQYPISGTQYYNAGTNSFSVTFSAAIAAFGFYATDIGDFGGQVTLTLNDVGGGSTLLTVPNLVDTSANGSALYFGFYDTGHQYSSITFGNTGVGDVFGFDDFSVGSLTQVVPATINTTGGDIASNIFSLGSKAAQAGTVRFDGGILRMIGGAFPDNVITAPVAIDTTNGTVDTSTGNGGFSGVVSGPGSLTIMGGGTFSLLAANTFEGGTIVDGSTVAIGSSTALGTGPLRLEGGSVRASADGLRLANAAVLTGTGGIDTQAFGLTYAGAISGTGALVKSGTGTLVLSGRNSFSGDTVVLAGTLQAGAASGLSPASVAVVGSGATLDLAGFDPTTAGLAGSGTVTNSAAAPVAISIGNRAASGFGGTIVDGVGGIALIKTGSGTLLLSGTNTYSGGTALQGGTLAVGSAGALGTGALRMDENTILAFVANTIALPNAIVFTGATDPTIDTGPNDATVAGPISGPGALTKIGTGTLDLAGTNTYTGETTVAQGTLLVDGATAASAATVLGGAVLGGFGTIGGLDLRGGGTLAPGVRAPYSTLRVAGDAAFQAGSTFAVGIDATGRTDAVAIGGTARIDGGTVVVAAANGTYLPGTRYTILTAAGGRSGAFSDVTTPTTLAFLTPTLGYTQNAVTLGFTQTAAFPSIATTVNGRNTAAAVQSLGPSNPVYGAVLGQAAAGARQAFGALSGEAHGSATTTAVQGSRLVAGLVLDRLWNIPGSGGGDASSALDRFGPTTLPTLLRCYAPMPGQAGEVPSHYTIWGQGIGDFGRSGGDGNARAVDRTLGGFAFGIDTRLDAPGLEAWRVGATAGYTNSGFSVAAGNGAGTYENAFGGLYAGARYGAIAIRLGATAGGTSTNLHRTVAFPGFDEAERSSYGGNTVQGFGELGYRFAFGEQAVLEPVVNAAVIHVHQDDFREKGGPAALRGFAQDVDVESTVLGFRGQATPFASLPVAARAFLGWQHSYGDIDPATRIAFASGSNTFESYGAPIDRDSVVGEAGVDWRATPAMTLGLFYAGQAGRRTTDNAVKGRIDYRF